MWPVEEEDGSWRGVWTGVMGEVHECHPVVDTGILDQKISRYGDKIYAV